MTRETFISRLKKIKELNDLLETKHELMVEHNPFIEDGGGVIPAWLTNLILEHVITLFAAVNEKAYYRTEMDEFMDSHPGMTLEEIANEIGMSVNKIKDNCEEVYVLTDLAEYFLYEMDWGGCISIGNDSDNDREYDFSDYGRLYYYIKEEL